MSGLSFPGFLRRRTSIVLTVLSVLSVSALSAASTHAAADDGILKVSSSVVGSDGATYTVTNHLTKQARTPAPGHRRREWLLAWAGDAGAGSQSSPDPDFLAVIDATPGTPAYGTVVNTLTIDSTFGNEPHHMQYVWHKGNKIYAGGILSDTTYVFDVGRLPQISLSGITLPSDTPCGSAPDAYAVAGDGTAYASYMGGPDISGPCTYTNGETRVGNGYAGSPGEIVHLGPNGRVLAEVPAATTTPEDAQACPDIPEVPVATCANPHGIAIREDLNLVVASDFAEIRDLLGTADPPAGVQRDTLRIFNIANRNNPRLVSVSHMPDGPRVEPFAVGEEPRGVMETSVTHQQHRGAFASTMGGGSIFYTPDITDPAPRWREVFDDETAFTSLFPTDTPTAGADAGAWLQTSPDDRFLYHVVMTGGVLASPPAHAESGMLYVLDIRPLLTAGKHTRCSIDTIEESSGGGAEPDCPKLVGAIPLNDPTSGGPHWAAMDNFRLGPDGLYHETSQVSRIAVSNYFVNAAHLDGDHRVCMATLTPQGAVSLDESFRDEYTGAPCVDFNRTRWPHGDRGAARPHGVLFTIADTDLR
jgi:hypothetical protein